MPIFGKKPEPDFVKIKMMYPTATRFPDLHPLGKLGTHPVKSVSPSAARTKRLGIDYDNNETSQFAGLVSAESPPAKGVRAKKLDKMTADHLAHLKVVSANVGDMLGALSQGNMATFKKSVGATSDTAKPVLKALQGATTLEELLAIRVKLNVADLRLEELLALRDGVTKAKRDLPAGGMIGAAIDITHTEVERELVARVVDSIDQCGSPGSVISRIAQHENPNLRSEADLREKEHLLLIRFMDQAIKDDSKIGPTCFEKLESLPLKELFALRSAQDEPKSSDQFKEVHALVDRAILNVEWRIGEAPRVIAESAGELLVKLTDDSGRRETNFASKVGNLATYYQTLRQNSKPGLEIEKADKTVMEVCRRLRNFKDMLKKGDDNGKSLNAAIELLEKLLPVSASSRHESLSTEDPVREADTNISAEWRSNDNSAALGPPANTMKRMAAENRLAYAYPRLRNCLVGFPQSQPWEFARLVNDAALALTELSSIGPQTDELKTMQKELTDHLRTIQQDAHARTTRTALPGVDKLTDEEVDKLSRSLNTLGLGNGYCLEAEIAARAERKKLGGLDTVRTRE